MINERNLYLHTPIGPPSLPRITRLVWERATSRKYRHLVAQRSERHAAVQITLQGEGAIYDEHGAIVQRCRVGKALIFITREHPLVYGYPNDRPVDAGKKQPWEFVYANFEGEVASLIISDLVEAHGHVLSLPVDHAVISALLALIPQQAEVHRNLSAAGNARLAFDLLSALVELNAAEPSELNAAEPSEENRVVDQAKMFLQAQLDKNIGVQAVADHCKVSREHLSRCFSKLVGEGPAAWLRRQRLSRAERLLLAGDLPIAEIAHSCGFASASHFARCFREHSGREPRRYRAKT